MTKRVSLYCRRTSAQSSGFLCRAFSLAEPSNRRWTIGSKRRQKIYSPAFVTRHYLNCFRWLGFYQTSGQWVPNTEVICVGSPRTFSIAYRYILSQNVEKWRTFERKIWRYRVFTSGARQAYDNNVVCTLNSGLRFKQIALTTKFTTTNQFSSLDLKPVQSIPLATVKVWYNEPFFQSPSATFLIFCASSPPRSDCKSPNTRKQSLFFSRKKCILDTVATDSSSGTCVMASSHTELVGINFLSYSLGINSERSVEISIPTVPHHDSAPENSNSSGSVYFPDWLSRH